MTEMERMKERQAEQEATARIWRERETQQIAKFLEYAKNRLESALADWPAELTREEIDRRLPDLARAEAILHGELQKMLGGR